jgi:tripartite-type tricarboxylate transporter receptor subunit TctC
VDYGERGTVGLFEIELAPAGGIMSIMSRRAALAGLSAFTLLPRAAFGQETPLKIVFPFAAGGAGDTVVRAVAENLQKSLGRPVIVENKTGAGGRIGAQAVKDAAPDGSTLLVVAGAMFTLQPHLSANAGYDTFVDFAPIARIVKFDQVLVVSSQIPVRSVSELAAWLKANPDQAAFGSPGAGTVPHVALLELGRTFGVALRHVPYRGTPLALPDLVAGRLPVYMASIAELIEHHKSGSIRIIATSGEGRNPLVPEVPTLTESGVGVAASGWFAFYAPAATPVAVRERLEKEIAAAAAAPNVVARIETLGFQPTGTSAQDLARVHRAEYDSWGAIIKASGIKLD